MKMAKKVYILIIICIIFIFLLQIIIIQNYLNGCESCKQYSDEKMYGINGIYNPNGFYCVWAAGLTNITEDIMMCHHLVYNDREKFCS